MQSNCDKLGGVGKNRHTHKQNTHPAKNTKSNKNREDTIFKWFDKLSTSTIDRDLDSLLNFGRDYTLNTLEYLTNSN